jgi:dihydrofolate reductase
MDSAESAGFFRVTRWVIDAMAWRDRHGYAGGEQSTNSDIVAETFEAASAYVMGRRMADGGELPWGDDPPFRAPVFVVTRRPRETLGRQGGTSFTYVTDGIASAVEQARAAANGNNVAVAGAGTLLKQVLGSAPSRMETASEARNIAGGPHDPAVSGAIAVDRAAEPAGRDRTKVALPVAHRGRGVPPGGRLSLRAGKIERLRRRGRKVRLRSPLGHLPHHDRHLALVGGEMAHHRHHMGGYPVMANHTHPKRPLVGIVELPLPPVQLEPLGRRGGILPTGGVQQVEDGLAGAEHLLIDGAVVGEPQ